MTEKEIKNSMDLMEKHHTLLSDFLKHIVMVSSAILAVFVSFQEYSAYNRMLFLLTALLLLCTILIGTAALYLQLVQIRILRKDYSETLRLKYLEPDKKKGISSFFSRYNKLALILEAVTVLSFLTSVVLLVCYAVL